MTKQEAYEFLYRMADGISKMFGNNCETLIQEVINGEMVTVAIFNGHVSGRKPMSQIGILGGKIADQEINYDDFMKDVYNQLVIHPSGKKIKSSTFILAGEGYKYALGINYDITPFEKVQNLMEDFLSFDGDLYSTLWGDSGSSLQSIMESCLKIMNISGEKLNKDERFVLIKLLNEKNFFDLQRSVPFLAEKLGVSKYTIYKDLKELEQE
jgi:predicted transcriptional regulator YheO